MRFSHARAATTVLILTAAACADAGRPTGAFVALVGDTTGTDTTVTDTTITDTTVIDSAAVASVTLAPDSQIVGTGDSAFVAAVLRNAAGAILRDRDIFWSTSDSAVAVVETVFGPEAVPLSQSGAALLRAGAQGTAIVQASSESQAGFALLVVVATGDSTGDSTGVVARVRLLPRRRTVRLGSRTAIAARLFDAQGQLLRGPQVLWATNDSSTVSIVRTVPADSLPPHLSGLVILRAESRGRVTISGTSGEAMGTASVRVVRGRR